MSDDRRVVWSSGRGRIEYCARCGALKSGCTCRTASSPSVASAPPRDGFLRVGRSSKGHAGKTVTTITGAPGSPEELRALLQMLKKFLGSGGTVQADGIILLQGDVRDRAERKLIELGFRTKRVGG